MGRGASPAGAPGRHPMRARARTGALSRTLGRLGRSGDLLLAAGVAGIVALMIVPVPTRLLDLLIAANLCLAVLLLAVCVQVSGALRVAALPSLLLVATLYRLGLNVSSTRLILLRADAGEVISAFGGFVVAGNLVVGAVVFLVLTVVQYVVIARGSERVAEVATRVMYTAQEVSRRMGYVPARPSSVISVEAVTPIR